MRYIVVPREKMFKRTPFHVKVLASLICLMFTFAFINQMKQFQPSPDNEFAEIDNEINHRLERIWEAQIESDLRNQVPGLGDYGVAVNLTGEAGERAEKDIATLSLNEELSKHMSYHRLPPDPRHEMCKTIKYPSNLPTTSVIIVFFNEPYSVLVRTVHSILDTVETKGILKEIIIVDDGSSLPELKTKLEYYVNTKLPKIVKLLRLPERLVCVVSFNDIKMMMMMKLA